MGHKNVPSSESWLVAGPTIKSAFFLVHLHQQHVFSFLSDPHLISTCRTTVFLSRSPSCASSIFVDSSYPQYTLNHTLTESHSSHTMDATTQVQPLADRPTNTHLANANVDKTDMKSADLSSMENHRQILQGKLDNGEK